MPWYRQIVTGNRQCAASGLLLSALVLLTAAAVQGAPGPGSWTRQTSGTLSWFHSVFFLDQNRGWAIGSKGVLLKTADGGETWRFRPKPGEDNLRDIYFTDEQNGWLVCERNIYELKTKDEPRSYLMNTKDGGVTWARFDMKDADIDARLMRAVFTRNGRGWVFGEAGMLFATRDGGENWTRLQIPTRHLLLGGDFVDNDRGWLVGAGATILQTSDGGDTWHLSKLTKAQGVRFNAASFVDNRIGWAVGGAGRIFHTINGGRTWDEQTTGVAVDLLDVKFLDASEGWAVGAEGIVIHTLDGGLHWARELTGTTHPLERVFFADRNHGWAVGFGGTIITYVRGSASGSSARSNP